MTIADYIAAIGTLLLFTGISLIHVPSALIALGVLLLAAGLWSHHSHVHSRPPVPARDAEPANAGDDGN